MEEVDSIILQFLTRLDINIPDDCKILCDLPVETLIESASKCLTTINPSLKLPPRLPSGISQRIEVAGQIASACKDLGYKNDVGYQSFLYHNEADLRQVFMFLIEHLPSEGTQSAVTAIPSTANSLLLQNIALKIGEELNTMWIPQCCSSNNKKNISDNISRIKSSVGADVDEDELVQELLKVKLHRQLKQEKPENVNPWPAQRGAISETLMELKETAIILKQKLSILESEKNAMDVALQQANKAYEKADAELKNVQNIVQSIGLDDLDKLNSVENIMEKVRANIEKLHYKSEEWTSKNLELKMEMDKIKSSHNLLESERSRCRKTLTSLKDAAKAMKEEYNNKVYQKDNLKKKYEKLQGGNKRSIYTKRILEIIANVDKQNLEIKKILDDTRQLQKEINTLEGQLDRCFSIADETLFGDAKKDDQAKKAYKLLALLHSECNTIVSLVNDTGTLAREIIDLEDNVNTEKGKRTENTLQKIQLDLAIMQEESKMLVLD